MDLTAEVKADKDLSPRHKRILIQALQRDDTPQDFLELLVSSYRQLADKDRRLKKADEQARLHKDKITELEQNERLLEDRLVYNQETGLPNKNLLDEELDELFRIANESNKDECMAVVFLALDESFDMLRKTMKPVVAEWVIYQTAERIREHLTPGSKVYHTRTNEFLILLRQAGNIEVSEDFVRKTLKTVTDVHRFPGQQVSIGCHMGVAVYPEHGTNKRRLLRNADIALTVGKSGRKQYSIYTKEMSDEVIERMELQNSILKALEEQAITEIDKQFELYYQPIVEVSDVSDDGITWKIKGAEALLRWNHPQKGSISPDRFIPLAEECGLIIPIGSWIFYTVAEHMARWRREGRDIYISVNLSPRQFQDEMLVENIDRVIEIKGLDPENIRLEITEGVVMDDPEDAISKMVAIHDKGIKMSIDDFGTGYSSLNYLRQFPIDMLKIDKSFVDNVTTDSSNKGIVRAVISMAKNMGIEVLAEGIEKQDQVEFLSREGCANIQGYFFSRPLPLSEFDSFLKKNLMSD